ncbi:araC family regulatory protein [Salmonella bongori]|nr:araC family regulatory protein [Salmonella bongori]
MLKSFTPSPALVGNIDYLQPAQALQRNSVSLHGLNLLQSVLMKLSTGKISIKIATGEYITATGPTLIFLAKGQNY